MDIMMRTIPEVAKTLRLAEVTVRKLIRNKRLAHLRLGSRILIREEDVIDFVNKNYHGAEVKK